MKTERRLLLYSNYTVLNIKLEDGQNPADRPEVAAFMQSTLVRTFGIIRSYIWEYDNEAHKGTAIEYSING